MSKSAVVGTYADRLVAENVMLTKPARRLLLRTPFQVNDDVQSPSFSRPSWNCDVEQPVPGVAWSIVEKANDVRHRFG